jgi:two-component system sensor histidine kinase YesM
MRKLIRAKIGGSAMLKRMLSKARVSMTKYNAQLFTAFIICSLVPLLAMGILSYRYTYRNAVERILQVTIRSDDLLNTRLNDRIRQVENVADTLQYDMYSLSQSHGKTSSELNTFNNVRNNISLYKSTFDFFHVFVFLPDDFIGSSEGLTFFPIENFNNYEVSHDSADALTSSDWFIRIMSKSLLLPHPGPIQKQML